MIRCVNMEMLIGRFYTKACLCVQDPIAILDFASLYPSLFMAHNL